MARNRVKRLLREAFRGHEASLAPGHDYVAVARPGLGALAEREGLSGVAQALGALIQSAGGAPGRPPTPDLEERHPPAEEAGPPAPASAGDS